MLVGLHGRKGSGKDTFYHRYCELYPKNNPERLAFADGLKRFICLQLDITLDVFEYLLKNPSLNAQIQLICPSVDPDDVQAHISTIPIKEWIQRTGTEAGQEVLGVDIWVNLTLPRPSDITWPVRHVNNVAVRGIDYNTCLWHEGREIFVTDVRFTHEADRIKELGGQIIQIEGSRSDGDTHLSEIPLPSRYISHHIYNGNREDNFRSLDKQIIDLFSPQLKVKEPTW